MTKLPQVEELPGKIAEVIFGRASNATATQNTDQPAPAPGDMETSIHAGHIQFLNVANLRKRFGAAWPEHSSWIHRIAATTARAHIGRTDRVNRIDDETYVIVLYGKSHEEARLLSETIASEIERKVLNCNFRFRGFSVQSAVKEITTEHQLKHLMRTVPPQLEVKARVLARDKPIAGPPSKLFNFPPETTSSPTALSEGIGKNQIWGFCPVWSVRANMVSTYRLTQISTGHDEKDASADLPPSFLLDLGGLRRACQIMIAGGDQPLSHYLSVPVHYQSTLDVNFRREFVRLCQTVSHVGRSRLVIELLDIPDALPENELREIVSGLHTICKSVVGNVGATATDLARYANAGIRVIHADIKDLGRQEREIISVAESLILEAEDNRLQSYFSGVSTLSMLANAVSAGACYLSGDILGRPSQLPRTAFPAQLSDIYAQCLPGDGESS